MSCSDAVSIGRHFAHYALALRRAIDDLSEGAP